MKTTTIPSWLHEITNAEDFDLPKLFNCPFYYEVNDVCKYASENLVKYIESRTEWQEEIHNGKMFGVLIVQNKEDNKLYFMTAFSGLLDGKNLHDYFVPPIYDLLNPEDYFLKEESESVKLTEKINILKSDTNYKELKNNINSLISKRDSEIAIKRAENEKAKEKRNDIRKQCNISPEEEQNLIKESQYQKAELKRLKTKWNEIINDVKLKIEEEEDKIQAIEQERHSRSCALQNWIFKRYLLTNGNGEQKNLLDIFHDFNGSIPPAGSGECCAPKLLNSAFKMNLKPICMAEFWYGKSPIGEIRHHKQYYPSCNSKCGPILNFMLKGLEVEENKLKNNISIYKSKIIYEDEWIRIIDKPAGMLSVPGKEENIPSVYSEYIDENPNCDSPVIVHRLDMETSGLLILAKTKFAHELLQKQFIENQVNKRYLAILDGWVEMDCGKIELPLIADFEDRPRQKVDYIHGKHSLTLYKVLKRIGSEENGNAKTIVHFYPKTGRTHQLRIHAAHHDGLRCPIVGDRLYGKENDRMYLHAEYIDFMHPFYNKRIKIESKLAWYDIFS